MYVESVGVTVLGLLALTALRRFEDKDDLERRHLSVVPAGDSDGFSSVVRVLAGVGIKATEARLEKRYRGSESVAIAAFDIVYPKGLDATRLFESIQQLNGVRRVVVQHRH